MWIRCEGRNYEILVFYSKLSLVGDFFIFKILIENVGFINILIRKQSDDYSKVINFFVVFGSLCFVMNMYVMNIEILFF